MSFDFRCSVDVWRSDLRDIVDERAWANVAGGSVATPPEEFEKRFSNVWNTAGALEDEKFRSRVNSNHRLRMEKVEATRLKDRLETEREREFEAGRQLCITGQTKRKKRIVRNVDQDDLPSTFDRHSGGIDPLIDLRSTIDRQSGIDPLIDLRATFDRQSTIGRRWIDPRSPMDRDSMVNGSDEVSVDLPPLEVSSGPLASSSSVCRLDSELRSMNIVGDLPPLESMEVSWRGFEVC